eukprot:gene20117-biopygen8526
MGLGPHPVARARRGLRNCRAAPPLSGLVGVRGTAVRPRTAPDSGHLHPTRVRWGAPGTRDRRETDASPL